jgi:hypothetical protein
MAVPLPHHHRNSCNACWPESANLANPVRCRTPGTSRIPYGLHRPQTRSPDRIRERCPQTPAFHTGCADGQSRNSRSPDRIRERCPQTPAFHTGYADGQSRNSRSPDRIRERCPQTPAFHTGYTDRKLVARIVSGSGVHTPDCLLHPYDYADGQSRNSRSPDRIRERCRTSWSLPPTIQRCHGYLTICSIGEYRPVITNGY